MKFFRQADDGTMTEVGEYSEEMWNSIGMGHTYIHRTVSGTSRRHNIDPSYLPVLAVLMECRDEICQALNEAFKARPTRNAPLTEKQAKLWRKFQAEIDTNGISYPSTHEVSEKVFEAVFAKVKYIESVPSLKDAYDQYMLMAKLALKEEDETD